MPKCKKSEGRAIDYAYKLLPPTEAANFEQHLKDCADCTEAVQSFTATLELMDMAQAALTVPERALRDIEMNVYKRLATAPAPQKQTLRSRWRTYVAPLGSVFRWHRTAAASTIAVALIAIAVFVGNPFHPKSTLELTEAQSADARIEQYRQQDIQRSLSEALITHHLRNDSWDTESQLQRMKEQAPGTNWSRIRGIFEQDVQDF